MSAPGVELPGYQLLHSGKVRHLYAPVDTASGAIDPDHVLLVASDRISAYDFVLDSPIPDKGAVLTQLSLWWFDQLADLVDNHVVSADVPEQVAGRAILVRRLQMLPVECIARAYLTGGGLAEYRQDGQVSGVALPPGLQDGSRLPTPVFTPSTKAAEGEHDAPISFAEVEALIGQPLAARVRDLTIAILERGNSIASERGVLIADTKVEFGIDPRLCPQRDDGTVDWEAVGNAEGDALRVVLADEVLTPDSSRFWRAEQWQPGQQQTSYDKQVLRDWLTSPASGWQRASGQQPPPLPDEVVQLTRQRYLEAFEALTGQPFRATTHFSA